MTLELWLLIPTAVIALGGVLGAIYKGARTFFKFDAALPVLFQIAAEFQTNGGSSLKDHLNRIEARVQRVEEKVGVDNVQEIEQHKPL